MDRAKAILIRKIRLNDTGVAITWLTESQGKIRTVARGAHKPGSILQGKLDLFFEAEIFYEAPKRGDLHPLKEVVLVHAFSPKEEAYLRIALASYFVELVELTTETHQPVPEIYDLLRRALHYLGDRPATWKAMEHFERELCHHLGLGKPPDAASALAHYCGRTPITRGPLLKQLPVAR